MSIEDEWVADATGPDAFSSDKWTPSEKKEFNIGGNPVVDSQGNRYKFRAWSHVAKHMFGPETLAVIQSTLTNMPKIGVGCTYMQYTGIKDQTGVEIYEGDIVMHSSTGEIQGPVVYSTEGAFIVDDGEGVPVGYNNEYLVVVGNIYENPGLSTKEN